MNDASLEKLTRTIEENNRKIILEANQQQTEILKVYFEKEIAELKEQFDIELTKKALEFEEKYNNLKSKCDRLERELNRNKIIIFGSRPDGENLLDFVVESLKGLLRITIARNDIDSVYAIGKHTENKPIIIKLVSYVKKTRNFTKL